MSRFVLAPWSRSRFVLAPWSRSLSKKILGAGAGAAWEKNQEPEPEPPEKKLGAGAARKLADSPALKMIECKKRKKMVDQPV